MPRRVKGPDGVLHVFPDDATDAEISTALSAPPPTARGAARERSWTDAAVDALPTAGGLAGGIIGGIGGTVAGMGVGGVPGAVGGATLGGGAGEALKQLVNRARGVAAPGTPLEAATGIGGEAVTQGVMEGAGAGLGAGARVVGKALVENAVRPTMSLVREFPDVMDTIVRERLPVGRALPGVANGSERAAEKLGESSQSVRTLLDKAMKDGTTFSTSQIAEPVLSLIDDIAKQPIGNSQMKQLDGLIEEFLQRHPGPLTPPAVKELKQQAQAIAKPIYSAVSKGFPVTADQSLGARFNSAVASGAKKSLETIPGVAAGEKRTQQLIGAKRALTQAENRRLSLAGELGSAALGGAVSAAVSNVLDTGNDKALASGITAWAVGRGLASPRTLSRTGLLLTNRQAQALLREFPRLAEYVVSQGTTE